MITTPNDLLTISQLRAELKAVKAQAAIDSEAASSLFIIIADISLMVGIRDSSPNICRETVKAVKRLVEERDAVRAALRPFADAAQYVDSPMYTAGRYVAGLNTVEQYHNARRVLGEVTS